MIDFGSMSLFNRNKMSDLRIVLYKDNRTPRNISLSTRIIYKTLLGLVGGGLLLVLSIGVATRFYIQMRAKSAQTILPTTTTAEDESGPSNSLEQQNRALRDQVDQLNSRISNANLVANAPKEIDKKNPALALFTPIVVDKTQDEAKVVIQNFKYTHANGKTPAVLTFELHNAKEGASTEKGYIVVVGRNEKGLMAYPNVFSKSGPYLLDFERGETFQVARFRMVNATFDLDSPTFQIFIFTRKGELLINTLYEVK